MSWRTILMNVWYFPTYSYLCIYIYEKSLCNCLPMLYIYDRQIMMASHRRFLTTYTHPYRWFNQVVFVIKRAFMSCVQVANVNGGCWQEAIVKQPVRIDYLLKGKWLQEIVRVSVDDFRCCITELLLELAANRLFGITGEHVVKPAGSSTQLERYGWNSAVATSAWDRRMPGTVIAET